MTPISIIMAVYNGQRFVSQAVDSLLAQTHTDFELICIDDGSTDDTPKILQSIEDPRICIEHQENQGLTKSLNRALRMAQGQYIARADVDEISHPQRLAKQLAILENDSRIGVVGTFCTNHYLLPQKRSERVQLPVTDSAMKESLFSINPFIHGSVMMRKSICDRVGGYDEQFRYSQDYELWTRIAPHCEFYNIPEPLVERWITNEALSSCRRVRIQQMRNSRYAQRAALRLVGDSWRRRIRMIPNALLLWLHLVHLEGLWSLGKRLCYKRNRNENTYHRLK